MLNMQTKMGGGRTCYKQTFVYWGHPVFGARVLEELGVRKQSQAHLLQKVVYQRVGEIEKAQREEALIELVVGEVGRECEGRNDCRFTQGRVGKPLQLESPLAENRCRRRRCRRESKERRKGSTKLVTRDCFFVQLGPRARRRRKCHCSSLFRDVHAGIRSHVYSAHPDSRDSCTGTQVQSQTRASLIPLF